jgi:hypothetical protein
MGTRQGGDVGRGELGIVSTSSCWRGLKLQARPQIAGAALQALTVFCRSFHVAILQRTINGVQKDEQSDR